MRRIIYLDVLLSVNFVIGFLLLALTGRLTGMHGGTKRLAAGGAVAAASSLLLLAPPMPDAAGMAVRLFAGALAVRVAFFAVGRRAFLRAVLCYGMLNFLLAGAVGFAVYRLGVQGVYQNNLSVYFGVSPWLLVGCVLMVWILLEIWACFFASPCQETIFTARLCFLHAPPVSVQLFYDTGLSVSDPYSGLPVLIVSWPDIKEKLPDVLAQKLTEYFKSGKLSNGIRLLPCETAAQKSLLPILPAQLVLCSKNRHPLSVTAAFSPVRLCGGRYPVLAGPQLATWLAE